MILRLSLLVQGFSPDLASHQLVPKSTSNQAVVAAVAAVAVVAVVAAVAVVATCKPTCAVRPTNHNQEGINYCCNC